MSFLYHIIFFDDYSFEFQIYNSEGEENVIEEPINVLADIKVTVDKIMEQINDTWTIFICDTVNFVDEEFNSIKWCCGYMTKER